MKKTLSLFLSLALMTGALYAGSSGVKLTAPQLTSWNPVASGNIPLPSALVDTAKGQINTQLSTLFAQLETQLNADYFSKLHDQTQLAKGFANANAAAFDNASLLSFQTYDLFALMVGTNVGAALPTLDPSQVGSTFEKVLTEGDVYLGLGLGGFSGQLGVNTSFLVPNLYVSAKAGFVPSTPFKVATDAGDGEILFQQGMFGVGANYTLVPQYDLLFGFLKWRGVSVGSGLVYNSNSTKITLAVKDYVSPAQTVALGLTTFGIANPTLSATVSDIKAVLTVDSSSVVIPLEVATSIQALWFLNVGLGAGVDLAFPTTTIKVGAGANLVPSAMNLAGNPKFSSGSAAITASDSTAAGDFFSPRLATSVGLNLAVFKLEIPISYYPITKAVAVGINGGIVW